MICSTGGCPSYPFISLKGSPGSFFCFSWLATENPSREVATKDHSSSKPWAPQTQKQKWTLVSKTLRAAQNRGLLKGGLGEGCFQMAVALQFVLASATAMLVPFLASLANPPTRSAKATICVFAKRVVHSGAISSLFCKMSPTRCGQFDMSFGSENTRSKSPPFPKGPKIEKIQSRLKISISLENFNLDWKFQSWPSEFPTKNRGLLGVGIEIFNLDWKFQSRRAILRHFFNLWALRV